MAEEIILQKPATYWRGLLTESGHLFLTHDQLAFLPRRPCVQTERVIINLEDIADVVRMDIGLSSEIHVRLKDGRRERFVMEERDEFIDAIKKHMPKKI